MPELHDNEPRPGNFELQQQFLANEQARLSAELFGKGVVSRILGQGIEPVGAASDLSGPNQLDAVYIPALQKTRVADGEKEEDVLALVAKVPSGNGGQGYTHYRLGMIDADGFLFPYPGVDKEDAEEVQRTALQLQALKEDGTLPNLNYNLLFINNPNTSMRAMPKSDL